MARIGKALVDLFSSLGLSAVLLALLGLLTWLGTLEQVEHGLYDVQKKYFESWGLIHRAGPVPIPLPGASLVLALLTVNLVVGGLIRIRKGWSMAGILVTHVGILMLIGAGFVKWKFSDEGHVTLYEGESADYYQSYYLTELVVTHAGEEGGWVERTVPVAVFDEATGSVPVVLRPETLPFDVELRHYMSNSRPLPKGPMFEVDVPVVENTFLRSVPRDPEAERNMAGLHVTVAPKDGTARQQGWLWVLAEDPFTATVDGVPYGIQLRKVRYPMPFTVVLDDFRKVDHPRMQMAKSFESDVAVVEQGTPRELTISMNKPLRDAGLVLYQASWGPSNARPGDPLFSTFAVVRNPADKYPLYACIVIAAGLLLHFVAKLLRFVRREVQTA